MLADDAAGAPIRQRKELEANMSKVKSKDGTMIAFEQSGKGPAVILVDGALCYRGFGPMGSLAPLLTPHFTVITYDRRGRGESADTQPYAVEREVEDIEALINAVGGSAFLYGISSGAALALEATLAPDSKVRKLAMYEAPYDSDSATLPAYKEYLKQLAEALAADRRGDAIAVFMKFVGTPMEQIEAMRHSPAWTLLEAVAPTLAYDAAVLGKDRLVPAKRAAKAGVPTLVMNGSVIPFMRVTAKTLAAVIPHAKHRTLEGQSHDVNPQVLAPLLVEFFQATAEPTHQPSSRYAGEKVSRS
jgi:pimeloyl-ACP methyl ester carboxylesterase